MVKIYESDTAEEMARKIFYEFEVFSSCQITGFVMLQEEMKLVPKGEAVLIHLRLLDETFYMGKRGNGEVYRKFKYRANSIGGPIAHKIFSYEVRVVDSEPRYTIWRFQ